MIYLKNEFAPKATLLSVLGLILGFSSVIFGIMNVSSKKSADHVPGIILIVVGAVIYILLGLVLPSKLSKKEAEKNIRTKAMALIMSAALAMSAVTGCASKGPAASSETVTEIVTEAPSETASETETEAPASEEEKTNWHCM